MNPKRGNNLMTSHEDEHPYYPMMHSSSMSEPRQQKNKKKRSRDRKNANSLKINPDWMNGKRSKPAVSRDNHLAEMAELAERMNNELPEDDDDNNSTVEQDKTNVKQDKFLDKVPEFFRDPLIVFIIYFGLSLPCVHDFIAYYIPQMGKSGVELSYKNIAVTGLILAVLYGFIRKLVL